MYSCRESEGKDLSTPLVDKIVFLRVETVAKGQSCSLLWLGGNEGVEESGWGFLEGPLRKLPELFTRLIMGQMHFLLE